MRYTGPISVKLSQTLFQTKRFDFVDRFPLTFWFVYKVLFSRVPSLTVSDFSIFASKQNLHTNKTVSNANARIRAKMSSREFPRIRPNIGKISVFFFMFC